MKRILLVIVLRKINKKKEKLFKMHIVIIGAGTAGLCAAKHALAAGCQVTVFELAKQVGGTWVYSDKVGTDEYGLDVHTSMYQGLQ